MSLWTPYAEQALDLSRTVKQEQDLPIVYQYSTGLDPAIQRPYTYSVPPVSPEEARNTWSPKITAPSPPQSPELYDLESLSGDVEYQAFERDAFQAMAEKNGGTLLGNNPRMRRAVLTNQAPDDSYRKQRERNNYAAKQSRDRRKLREVRLAFQVSFLKKKMAELRTRLSARYCARCQQQCRC